VAPAAAGLSTEPEFRTCKSFNPPFRCLVRSILLVLSVLRSTEAQSLLSAAAGSAGHKLVQASSSEQAHILLSNGLEPDLVILEASDATSLDLDGILRLAKNSSVCLVCEPGTKHREIGRLPGVDLFLERPLTSGSMHEVFEVARGSQPLIDSPEQGICRADTSGQPILEELGDGRYFLAAAPSTLKIYRQVRLLADVDAPVLILGESGTGKEVIAHLIHKHSRRSRSRFVNVNCAALPADLLESELFGYQKGAFTGAIKDKPGKFELANGGTLLLDEIGEMSAQMQAKLLHVLQDGQFARLGARESSRADVRVIAATNVQIESALVGKTFREDLYYRLNVFTINVPPLRERREEIPYFIEQIVRRLPEELRTGTTLSFSSRLMDAALLYDWRGNIRELRNFVTRTMTMRDPESAIHELESKIAAGCQVNQNELEPVQPLPTRDAGMRSIVRNMKDRAEAQMIHDALEVSGWNRRHAAQYLNISYRGLLYKIQQHRLAPKSHA
jgi:two-component system, NtrC family, response regulator AtoC